MQLVSDRLLALFGRHLRTVVDLVTLFVAIVTNDRPLLDLSDFGGWKRQIKPGMDELAVGPFRAEAAHVVDAGDAACVSMAAVGTVSTEAAIVPRTISNLRLWINVQKRTFFVAAGVEATVEVTLGHFRHVVLVQKFALVSLLTKTTEPMLAHNRSVTLDVTVGTIDASGTTAFEVKNAHCRAGLVHAGKR